MIVELKRQRAAVIAEARTYLEAAKKEERGLNEDERSKYDAAVQKAEELKSRIDVEDQQLELERSLATKDFEKETDNLSGNDLREFGDFLQEVRWNPNSTNLKFRESVKDGEKRDMSMGVGAAGGFIVPEQFDANIRMVNDQEAIFRPRAQTIPAGDPPDAAITIPALDQSGARGVYAGVTVNWIAEGAEKPETEPGFREIKLEPQEVAAITVVTDKLLRNSAAAGALISSLLRKAIVGSEEDVFCSGDGVGKPLGIVGHPATIAVGRAAPNTIAYGDIAAMYARAKFGGRLAWVASQTALPQLMQMVDLANNLVWQPNARDGAPGTLIGLPVLLNDQSPVLGNEGDIMLVDLDYYLIKDGSGIAIAMSEHARFTRNQTIIKAYWNVDGQSWLSTPLLQRDGVSTVSPFVALQ